MSLIVDYIKQTLPPNWRSSPSGWISGNCPMCHLNGESRPDTKGRGGVVFEDDGFRYNCFNCGYVAGWEPGSRINNRLKRLLLALGADESEVYRMQLELLREDDFQALIARHEKKQTEVTIDWEPYDLPPKSQPLAYCNPTDDFIEVVEYMNNRGLDITDERWHYSTVLSHGNMRKRFILPFTYKGVNVGYTARWAGVPPPGVPKYYKQQPKHYVYGLDYQDKEYDFVIVTEGELDAIITGGVSIGTNSISQQQIDIIDSLGKQVILLPDADIASERLVHSAVAAGWSVAFPEWADCKDANDASVKYGRLFTVKSILTSAVDNPTKAKVLAKKYCK